MLCKTDKVSPKIIKFLTQKLKLLHYIIQISVNDAGW